MARISIYDSTLRDGAQAQGISYSVEDKLKIVERLDALGVGERFVARPLSAKALRYAVTSGLAAAGAAPIVAPAIVEPAVAPVALSLIHI